MAAHSCNPSTLKMEAGASHPGLHSKTLSPKGKEKEKKGREEVLIPQGWEAVVDSPTGILVLEGHRK